VWGAEILAPHTLSLGIFCAVTRCSQSSALLLKRADFKCRILIGQTVSICGTMHCMLSRYTSIAFIVLIQLNYAIAPKLWRRPE